MRSATKRLGIATLAALPIVCANADLAPVVTGRLWRVPEAVSRDGVVDNVPLKALDAVLRVDSPSSFLGDEGTLADSRSSGDAFNIVENTPSALLSPINETIGGGEMRAIVDLTGYVTVTHREPFTAAGDDGVTLIIVGPDLEFHPTPTVPIVSSIAEPSTVALLAVTLTGIGYALRSKEH